MEAVHNDVDNHMAVDNEPVLSPLLRRMDTVEGKLDSVLREVQMAPAPSVASARRGR